jgi:hypothetical protein
MLLPAYDHPSGSPGAVEVTGAAELFQTGAMPASSSSSSGGRGAGYFTLLQQQQQRRVPLFALLLAFDARGGRGLSSMLPFEGASLSGSQTIAWLGNDSSKAVSRGPTFGRKEAVQLLRTA